MTQRCDKCGTELFTGQQFCRLCGTPTRAFTSGEIPTQILPEGGAPRAGQTADHPAQTTPLPASRDTADPAVYPSRHAGRQPAPQPGVGRRGPRRGLVLGLLAAVVVSVGASVFIARQITMHWVGKKATTQRQVKIVVPQGELPEKPEMPPMPGVAEPPEPEEHELEDALDEAGAEVSGDKTVVTKTFPLDADGSFALGQLAGDISIEGWDAEEAEVRITKRGGTAGQRAEVGIMHAHADDELRLETAGDAAANGVRDVQYAIRLPRRLRRIEISARDANVRLSGLGGNIAVNLMRGNIDLDGVSGTVSTRTTKGHTKIAFADDTPAAPQVFNGVNGDIELRLKPGTNADLKAETIDGRVEADDDLGLRIDRRLAGEQAVGRLGTGGHPIVIKTVSGNIKIRN